MNAQEMLLDYAKNHNTGKAYTNEQFVGKAIIEGIRIEDTPEGHIVTCNIKREGRTIIVTETISKDTPTGKEKTTSEIFRVNV